jgi:uncharacterized glyoxalase superfamily protein PhnB
MKIPSQYLPVMPYLIVEDARGLLEFTKIVFQAKEQLIAPDEKGSIMHGEIKIDDAVIMFANSNDNWKAKTGAMFIYVDDVNKIYARAMENKAISLEKPVQKDYGYTAGFEDPHGNHWFIVEAAPETI